MNTDTGELRRMASFASEEMAETLGFTKVPKEFEKEAMHIITKAEAEGVPAYADLTEDSPLVNWACTQQHNGKKKSRVKMAKASKRRNRIKR